MSPFMIAGLGGAALGGVAGLAQGIENRKRQKEYDNFRKAAIQYSPWSGIQDPGAMNAGPGPMGAALQGGMGGALAGMSIANMGAQNSLLASKAGGAMQGVNEGALAPEVMWAKEQVGPAPQGPPMPMGFKPVITTQQQQAQMPLPSGASGTPFGIANQPYGMMGPRNLSTFSPY